MSNTNKGKQLVTWKYYTALKGEQLATLIGHMSSAGVVAFKDPLHQWEYSGSKITISPASFLVKPQNPHVEDALYNYEFLVKVVLGNSDYTVDTGTSLSEDYVLCLKYDFTSPDGTNSDPESMWADIELIPLDQVGKENASLFTGIVIGTCVGSTQKCALMGADLSDLYLLEQGWNPMAWVSPISPRRYFVRSGSSWVQRDLSRTLELRKHNDQVSRYVSTGYNMTALDPVLVLDAPNGSINPYNANAVGGVANYLAIGIGKTVNGQQAKLQVLAAASSIEGLKIPLGATLYCILGNYFTPDNGIEVRTATYYQDTETLSKCEWSFLSEGSPGQILVQTSTKVPQFSDATIGNKYTGVYLKNGCIVEATPALRVLSEEQIQEIQQSGGDITGLIWLESV